MESPPSPGTAVAVEKSPLEKPLRELTEDDIAQVTREDCRRFLKEKGMRRPSWNKSQAIQQVISLKALLEVSKKDDGDDDKNNRAGPASYSTKTQREEDDDSSSGRDNFHSPPLTTLPPSVSPALTLPYPQQHSTEPGTNVCSPPSPFLRMISPETVCVSPRDVSDPVVEKASVTGQMTVFYNGKVNVFGGVSPEKLAASQDHCGGLPSSLVELNQSFDHPQPNPILTITPRPFLPPMTAFATQAKSSVAPIRFSQFPQAGAKRRNSQELELDGPTSRKALLESYLEKRKDRCQNLNEQHHKCDFISPHSKPLSTPTRCNSFEQETQIFCLPFDLNDDVREI